MRFSDLGGPLAAEIQQEMAASYFAGCKKMVACLKALREFDHIHVSVELTQKQLKQRSKLLEEASERVHAVVIQREALQLSDGDQFFSDYEVPDEVKMRLRPR